MSKSGGVDMIYICKHCGFLFERVGETDRCPDCGKPGIGEANDEEKKKYDELRKELGGDDTGREDHS
jgi:rRNA maturation endonuclease Nob1